MADDDFVKTFTSFMESQGAVLKEISVRIRALERYLKTRDSSFWPEYDAYLRALRIEAKDASSWLHLLEDGKPN